MFGMVSVVNWSNIMQKHCSKECLLNKIYNEVTLFTYSEMDIEPIIIKKKSNKRSI